ncbi:hypothetical protein EMCRGX_G017785 [Ephydatia muelleri]
MAEQSAKVVQRCEDAKGSKRLMLNECDLSKFPDAVFLLIKGVTLESVDLSRNVLKKVHTQLGIKFATITSLDLSYNQLGSLPDSLRSLVRLEALNLSHNQFNSYPSVLPQVNSLQSVDLSHNSIAEVSPDELAPLASINLSHNPLTDDTKLVLRSVVRVNISIN